MARLLCWPSKLMSASHEKDRSEQTHDRPDVNVHGEVMHAQRREMAHGSQPNKPTTQQANKTTSRQGETRAALRY
jgi:hypothetical protein